MQTEENPEIEVIEEVDEVIEEVKLWSLVVFNDDVNTFDHVIASLVEVCQHKPEQAEQCALIIHFKGKCAVNSGEYEELVQQRNQLCQNSLSAEVMMR